MPGLILLFRAFRTFFCDKGFADFSALVCYWASLRVEKKELTQQFIIRHSFYRNIYIYLCVPTFTLLKLYVSDPAFTPDKLLYIWSEIYTRETFIQHHFIPSCNSAMMKFKWIWFSLCQSCPWAESRIKLLALLFRWNKSLWN